MFCAQPQTIPLHSTRPRLDIPGVNLEFAYEHVFKYSLILVLQSCCQSLRDYILNCSPEESLLNGQMHPPVTSVKL